MSRTDQATSAHSPSRPWSMRPQGSSATTISPSARKHHGREICRDLQVPAAGKEGRMANPGTKTAVAMRPARTCLSRNFTSGVKGEIRSGSCGGEVSTVSRSASGHSLKVGAHEVRPQGPSIGSVA